MRIFWNVTRKILRQRCSCDQCLKVFSLRGGSTEAAPHKRNFSRLPSAHCMTAEGPPAEIGAWHRLSQILVCHECFLLSFYVIYALLTSDSVFHGLSYCSSPYFIFSSTKPSRSLSTTARRLSKSFQAKRLSGITQASSSSTLTLYCLILTSRLWSGLQLVAVETILWNRHAVHACWLVCYGLCCITLRIS